MAAGVCFKSEQRGWMQDQWSWVFSNFGITDIWERDRLASRDAAIYQESVAVDTAADLPLDRPLVIITPISARHLPGNLSLLDYKHPDDAIYFFGGSFDVLGDDDLGARKPDALVYIPTVNHELFSHTSAYVTLWDRYVKRGCFG
jgi:hypothetical protein